MMYICFFSNGTYKYGHAVAFRLQPSRSGSLCSLLAPRLTNAPLARVYRFGLLFTLRHPINDSPKMGRTHGTPRKTTAVYFIHRLSTVSPRFNPYTFMARLNNFSMDFEYVWWNIQPKALLFASVTAVP